MTKHEMVRLAAERVMGWKSHSCAWHTAYKFPKSYPFVVAFTNGKTALWKSAEEEHASEWNPTISDADALMLLDKLAGQGHRYSMEKMPSGIIRVGVQRCDGDWLLSIAEALTRPLAITMACLRAVGVEVGDAE